MGLDLSSIIKKVREEKEKYHRKLLTPNAEFSNLMRTYDLEPHFSELAWKYITNSSALAMSLSLLLDIPLADFENINLEFSIDLPSFEELQQGIKLHIEPIDMTEMYYWMAKMEAEMEALISSLYRKDMTEKRTYKGVYGESRYGYAYFDPPKVREFIRSTLLKYYELKTNEEAFKQFVDTVAERLKIAEGLKATIYNRLKILDHIQDNSFVLGYSVLGRSRLSQASSEETTLKIRDYYGEEREVKFKYFAEGLAGFILGVTALGYGYVFPRTEVLNVPEKKGDPTAVKVIKERVERNIERFRYTAIVATNYSRPDEMIDVNRSDRAHQYMTLQTFRYLIENIVANRLRKRNVNRIQMRQYKNAVLTLISLKAKRHSWGWKLFEALTEDELKEYWIDMFVKQGLDRDILEELYELIKPYLSKLREIKKTYGDLVKIRRRFRAYFK